MLPHAQQSTPPERYGWSRGLAYLRPYQLTVVIVLAAVAVEAAFLSGLPYSFKFIVDDALLGGNGGLLVRICLALAAGVIVISVLGLGRDYLFARIVSRGLGDIRVKMFAHLQHLSMGFYANAEVGDIMARFTSDMVGVEAAAEEVIPWVVLPAFDVGLNTILLFSLDWHLAMVAMLVWPMAFVGPRYFARRVSRESYWRKEEEAKAMSAVQEHIGAQPVVKAFGLHTLALETFIKSSTALSRRILRLAFFGAMVERSADIGILALRVAVLGVGAYFVSQRAMSIGELAAFQALFMSLSSSLSYITQFIPTLVSADTGFARIEELLDETPRVRDPEHPVKIGRLAHQIEFQDVTFGYNPEHPTLSHVFLTIPKGSSVAFVGESGSGKSTVLSLLLRFYDPQQGAVLMDGVDMRAVSQESLRAQMSFVFQDSFLFNRSVGENIRMGRLDATFAEIVEAAKAAEIHDAIIEFPDGYETIVGDRGGRLSGGQRQRIAIARALLRNPEIVILDEATSALDPSTESAINETLERAAVGRTAIVVTHRLGTVVHCDRIFVMENGAVVEVGPHRELLAADGVYARLWRKQSGFAVSREGHPAFVTTDRLRDIPIFTDLSEDLLLELADQLTTEHVPAGHTITVEGDVGEMFYIIVRGKVNVVKRTANGGKRRVARLHDGDHFGEVALLRSVRRTATVTTLVPSVLLALHRAQFDSLLARAPEFRKAIEDVFAERIRNEIADAHQSEQYAAEHAVTG